MEQLTAEDYKNILVLIQRVPDIKGNEALTVALILQKVQRMYDEVTKGAVAKSDGAEVAAS